MKQIFSLTSSIFSLGRELSLNPAIHPEMIMSGFAWKALQHCFFALWNDADRKDLVADILRDSVFTLQHLTSFSFVFTHQMQTNNSPFSKDNIFY